MCFSYRQLDPKTSRLMRIANLSLILGILLCNAERWNWVHASSPFERNWLDAFTGFFFSLYIGIMLFGLRSARGCRATEPENL
ncbi:MAG: hypothetical protein ABSD44_07710 [Terracidiphilus sp.]